MSSIRTFNLADLLGVVVETVPRGREALVCGSRRVSYQEFYERAKQLALWLRSQGIAAGDTLGIHAYSSIEFMEATFAAYMIKSIPVNVNYRYTASEACYIYDNAQLKGLVYNSELEDCVADALLPSHKLKVLLRIGEPGNRLTHAVAFEDAVAAGTGSLEDIEVCDDDLFMQYTGGTTGRPKGVLWSHKAIFHAAFAGGGSLCEAGPIEHPQELADRVRETYPLRIFVLGPLIHGNGMWATTIALLAGCTALLNDRPDLNIENILDVATREKVNVLNVIGNAMVIPLLDALKSHPERWDLSSIVCVANGGAMLSPDAADRLRACLPSAAVIVNSMGSTETGVSGAGCKPGDGGLIRLKSSDTVDVAVGGERFAHPGEMGILVRMGYIPEGYFRDPGKTAETFVTIDGKRCAISGDIARREEDGSITIFGRDSQCINTGGEKVFVEEVEEVLLANDSVKDALVLGIEDSRWGQKVVAVITTTSATGENAAALKDHCRMKLAGYKVPKEIVFVSEVPRGPAGKANYAAARSLAESALATTL
ncbi:MAG: AMP-binding protein [Gammaproteobacteria bacterium]|nr:AMP-binding protein [Gammaproteobacteria bacterium]